ncbi:MAG: hypothetical protein C0524_09880 [Rhodobacter sp.]|nr:hypothetical protein [Rhodobacter sp.]
MTPRTLPQSRPRRQAPMQIWAALKCALTLARSRGQLARLDDHILRDIGLTRAQAEAEATRPVWDAPAHWRC